MTTEITLHTGMPVASTYPQFVRAAIQSLLEKPAGLMALHDLVHMAHDRNYRAFQACADTLAGSGLVEADGRPHSVIADVIRAMFDAPQIGSNGPVLTQRDPITGAEVTRVDILTQLLG